MPNITIKKMHLTLFLNKLIKHKFKIVGIPHKTYWYEFDDYEDYQNFTKLNKNKLKKFI